MAETDLRRVAVTHWGFDGRVHRGEIVVHAQIAGDVLKVFRRLFDVGYPIAKVAFVDAYASDDSALMAANVTSGFNCRKVAGTSTWSEHAFGRAVDVNPIQNPYVSGGGSVVEPPAGRHYVDRSRGEPGMIHPGDDVVTAFAAIGWSWGGNWTSARDYQHFSSTGR